MSKDAGQMPTERPHHAGLRHVALNVRDMAAMRRFYTELLGFQIEWEPDADNVYLSSGTDNLALHRSPATRASRSTELAVGSSSESRRSGTVLSGALDHLGLIVKSPEDVDRWAAFVESRGVTLDAPPRTHRDGARSCYFHDPDGNRIQIIHHPPISGKV
jgi:catechol 2,3-dioxygenase-like lactoylglutathione lyase family enzyme